MPIVVAFVSQKGGVGKSTLARALAAVAAAGGLTVSLADLDAQQRTSLLWGSRRPTRDASSLRVRLFGSAEEAVSSETDADLLIIDAPARAGHAALAIAMLAHLVVQPSGASVDDLHPAILFFHELVAAGVPTDRLVMALCRTADVQEEMAARSYVAEAGYAVLPGAMPERAAYRASLNVGRAPTETANAELNARVDGLMDALLKAVMTRVEAGSSGQQQGSAA